MPRHGQLDTGRRTQGLSGLGVAPSPAPTYATPPRLQDLQLPDDVEGSFWDELHRTAVEAAAGLSCEYDLNADNFGEDSFWHELHRAATESSVPLPTPANLFKLRQCAPSESNDALASIADDTTQIDVSSVVDRQCTVPPGQPDNSLSQAECALLNAAMQPKGLDWKTGAALRASVANFLKALEEFAPSEGNDASASIADGTNQDIDVSSAFALTGDRHCTAVSPDDSVFNGSSPQCSRGADVPTYLPLPGQETGTNLEVSSDSSVQTGERHRSPVPLNGTVTPDMPSPLDIRTVASSTVSCRTGRLTYPYALTTTPCTEALSTATGGPNAFYAERGFPWCNLKLDANHDYEEVNLGFECSE